MSASPILVVEDNMLIAMEIEIFLSDLGFDNVKLVSSVSTAIEALERVAPVFAIIDVRLGAETSEPIARSLRQRETPFVFATGYADKDILSDQFPGTAVLPKPFTRQMLALELERHGLASI